MAEKIMKSPGVSAREIDLSQPGQFTPKGTPAAIIGTSEKGPAFVPVTFASMADFRAQFGGSDGERFAPIAVAEWMRNAKSGAFLRVLGVGDGKKKGSNSVVNKSGFVVGNRQVQNGGTVSHNIYAGYGNVGGNGGGGGQGRTWFLGAIMSESNGSTYFQDSNINTPMSASIVRGVLMFPSGVLPGLSGSGHSNPTSASAYSIDSYAATFDAGGRYGSMDLGANGGEMFTMYLNGYTGTYAKVLTASMDPGKGQYFPNVFNTDPAMIEERGHLLYSHFDVDASLAVCVPLQLQEGHRTRVLINTGSGERASFHSSRYAPNYEGFETRFKHAFSPWVISQNLGNSEVNLFKFHALDAGIAGNGKYKISIQNIEKSRDVNYKYGKFDVLVRAFADTDSDPIVLEKYIGCDLDPNSERFVSRLIGDQNTYFDFDKNTANQKLIVEGSYANNSQYVRVELPADVKNGRVNEEVLPVGFRGLYHLVTSGSAALAGHAAVATHLVNPDGSSLVGCFQDMQTPPVRYRSSVAAGTGNKARADQALCWGVQFEKHTSVDEPNKSTVVDPTIVNWTKFHPNYEDSYPAWTGNNQGTANQNAAILDADVFHNGKFSLEKVYIKVKSDADEVDPQQWSLASYKRAGSDPGTSGYRFLNVSKDFEQAASRRYYKFNLVLQGGFDGVNVFDRDKAKMLNAAAQREMSDSAVQGGTAAPTVAAYRKALDVISEKSTTDIQLLAIPGLREPGITDYGIDKVEDRFDALYIMDIEECNHDGTADSALITGSAGEINVGNTAARLQSRSLDSSFAAAYFPDVLVTDATTGANVRCPPSVAVMGALAYNDKVAHPWFAPAGFNRGGLSTTTETQVKFSRANLDSLYEVDINPITSFPQSPGVVVFGQKTLLAAQSALDRVNVRRLLIDVRRKVKKVANGILFEPNRAATLARFSGAVQPILARIQAQQGLDRFKVVIDTTTTTQADVENNTVRGKIFLQPTRSVEFISLDFVVTNAGAEI
jgi:hypothetical protein